MPLTAVDYFGLFFGITFVIGAVIIIVGMPILTTFFPKELESKVMKPPYFQEYDAMALSYFPLNLQRTIIVTSSICLDFYGKRYNGLQIARKLAPAWYRRGSYILLYGGLFNSIVSIGLVLLYLKLT
jgi:hypothetical protein